MDIKGRLSMVGPWGWAAGGVLVIGLVLLVTKKGGGTSAQSNALPAADINDWLNQLQTAVSDLKEGVTNGGTNGNGSTNPEDSHPRIEGSKPGVTIDPVTGGKIFGIGGIDQVWDATLGKYVWAPSAAKTGWRTGTSDQITRSGTTTGIVPGSNNRTVSVAAR